MEKQETRLLEEWKANNDLFKFHEDLKQKRFAHFLTIQTAFLAIFGLLGKETLSDPTLLRLLGLVLMSAPPLFIASYFIRVDARAHMSIPLKQSCFLLRKSGRPFSQRITSRRMSSNSKCSSITKVR